MTRNDKINLLRFITRPSMYIFPEDKNSAVSFIHGYTLGTNGKCNFMQLLKQLLTEKYKTHYDSDGWPGQINRLAKKKLLSWFITFRTTALEVIADERSGGLDKEMTEIFTSKFIRLIKQIQPPKGLWFNDWMEEWSSLCSIKSEWFKNIWTDSELKTIKSINRLVRTKDIFLDENDIKSTSKLIKLKEQYDQASNYRAND